MFKIFLCSSELVKDKETGYTCGIGNSQELSQRLIMVLEQENSSITESAYQLALSNLHVDMAQANHNIYLDLIISNEDVKAPKPDPEMYLLAMKKFNLNPNECLIIEDNEHGVQAALASGAHLLKVSKPDDVSLERINNKILDIESIKD